MKVLKIFACASFLFSSLVFATGANAPKGWWSCSFFGSEWQMVPGPGGIPHNELQPRVYSSDWHKNRDEAYNEALQNCEDWSDTDCSFDSCRQKKSL